MINVYTQEKLKIFGTGASFVVTSPRDDVHQRKCPATTRRPCVVHPSSPLHIRHVFIRQRDPSAPPFLYRRSCSMNTLTQKCPQRQVAKPKHIHAKPGRHKQYSRIQIKSVAGPALHSFLTGQQTVTTTTYDTNKRGQGRRKHHDTASLRNSSK